MYGMYTWLQSYEVDGTGLSHSIRTQAKVILPLKRTLPRCDVVREH